MNTNDILENIRVRIEFTEQVIHRLTQFLTEFDESPEGVNSELDRIDNTALPREPSVSTQGVGGPCIFTSAAGTKVYQETDFTVEAEGRVIIRLEERREGEIIDPAERNSSEDIVTFDPFEDTPEDVVAKTTCRVMALGDAWIAEDLYLFADRKIAEAANPSATLSDQPLAFHSREP